MENTNKYIRTIEVYCKEIKNGNQSFISALTKINGNWFKVKFTKACINNPRVRGIYFITINFDDCSIEQGSYYENKKGESKRDIPIIWINNILNIKKKSDEELKAENRKAFEDIFNATPNNTNGSNSVKLNEYNIDDELPF